MAVDMNSVTDVAGGGTTGALQEVGSRLMDKLFGGILWFGIGLLLLGVVGYLGWYFLIYKKKFDIVVQIKSERAEDKSKLFSDKGAILTDSKSGGKYLRLWNTKVELPAPKFNILQVYGRTDYVELYRTSDNKFYYLTPARIEKTYLIKSDGKQYPMADQTKTMIDPEMDFWVSKRKKINKDMFAPDSPLSKLLMYLPFILSLVVSIFIIWILMSKLPGVLSQLAELVQALNQNAQGVVVG